LSVINYTTIGAFKKNALKLDEKHVVKIFEFGSRQQTTGSSQCNQFKEKPIKIE
jgi:hypothetical protein